MNLEKRLEIYKAEYYFQIDFKEKLYARMAIYAVLITGCITANITMFDTLILNSEMLLTFFIFLWEVMIVLLIFTLYGFYCLSHIKLDSWTNTSSDMENYRNVLENHYIQHSQTTIQDPNFETEKQEYVNDQYTLYLVEQYSQCATVIRDNNIYRQRWLLKIMSCTYALLILTGILGCIYLIVKI
ncbi:hypothetical protein MJ012_09980 [Acinetobacter baumannii]|uniref:SMODS and SLOG-associating 2TM effector domain-containing protein n=3 Tax=Acinetobacter baumannii TaxID=470 RepID=A0A062I7H2_ACIBA|nr:hypothetical protein [Acinetobacter baumannii]ANC35477.1 hypothetical protein Aba3207_02105 [Acinetobacter baumannii]AXX40113.1 hypothetical protein Aba9201_03320 [Acinetobacter baumannii]EKT8002565.1 hypothetical protein [Acinetobacter baumannii]EKU1731995.1 hypothetical protein [Acinetobacter baumannii]EKV2312828.1 hypothetical protein [Acinetobacter baumannii]